MLSSNIFSLSTILLLGTLTQVSAFSHGSWGSHGHTFQKRQKVIGDAAILAIAPLNSLVLVPKLTNSSAYWIAEKPGVTGACGVVRTDQDFSFGITRDLWNYTGLSPLCGTSVFIQNPINGKNVTAIVSDESVGETSLLSFAAFIAISDAANNLTGLVDIQYYFINATTAGKAILASARVAVPSSTLASTSAGEVVSTPLVAKSPAPFETSSIAFAAKPSSLSPSVVSSNDAAPSPTFIAPSSTPSSSSTPAPSPTQAPTPAKELPSTASFDQASANSAASVASVASIKADEAGQSSASAQAAASASSKSVADAAYASSTSAAAKSQPTKDSSASSHVFGDGIATFFFQNGVAGNCGTVASDNDKVIAIESSMYAGGKNCGRQILITRTSTGATAVGTVRDSCPTCVSSTSLDLSQALFNELGTASEGIFSITWKFL